jgi:hypothetical protein
VDILPVITQLIYGRVFLNHVASTPAYNKNLFEYLAGYYKLIYGHVFQNHVASTPTTGLGGSCLIMTFW